MAGAVKCSVQPSAEAVRCSTDPPQPIGKTAAQVRPSPGVNGALRIWGLPVKWASLVLLTFVTTWTIFAIKLARRSSQTYLNSSVVLVSELLKFGFSFSFLALETKSFGLARRALWVECRYHFLAMLKLGVPGLAYTIQNNLIFLSVDLLSAAVQQVTYQLKILTAALLSVLMLGRTVGVKKWVALFVLVAGVMLVQVPRDLSDGAMAERSAWAVGRGLVGFLAALGACFASGFGGVYMEMVLKGSGTSIWLRNAQLAVFGAVTALAGVVSQDLPKLRQAGLLQGYTAQVWLMAFTVALGGLLVAAVLKYADNLLRQFSTAISVILTTALSAWVLHDITLDIMFGVGTALTIGATFMYSGLLDQFLPSWMLR
ncbi:unnamed protein product [Effrenium voratum]|uniref:Uncharacterized protein n=1 Tax=Effrenium voratum TaxID=2562239 RepID=A0AA36I0W0_9DINO|nr:unnamed protein product [Effrenium voratum]CAJ1434724.1 unnamed protein product [Effrenium voratum]